MRCRTRGSSANLTICWMSCLPPSSAGCALPAITSLHRALRVEQQRGQPLRVVQHQGQPLVGRHPAGEADGQHVLVQRVLGPAQLGLGHAALPPGGAQPLPRLGDQAAAQHARGSPTAWRARSRRSGPRPGRPRRPGRAAAPPARPRISGSHPGGDVDPVGDRADRHLAGVEPRPQAGEHLLAHPAVQLAHPVDPLGQPHAHHGHVEHRRVPARVGLRAQREDAVERAAPGRAAVPPNCRSTRVAGEPVDTGGHRGVRGEHGAGPAHLDRLVEAQARLRRTRGSAPGRGSRRGPRWCGRPRAAGGRSARSRRAPPALRPSPAAVPGAAGARCRRRRAGR